ncbi:TIGR01459 family HAD-type hydrolase [Hyphococcus flavus]|uniref:TIGR01459 family HAD-type hydrolase n=1 Tax=Hyphococcus flavus TaxID=1866326 RepID=A0AAE9ZHC4_9PROT|nr:TIGR01459 family HAD-type hydrolase [Hyphococcus flavus]WDI32557.1 TIGR01459 family HAD-type hydrolase [Hyphococcus flavus]
MSRPRFISSIRTLASDYDAMLCDAWGVIHNGVELIAGVEEAMINFRKARGPIIILTNAPRPSSIIPAQLDRLGLSSDAYDAVVTSGDATRAMIERHLPAPAFRIGPSKDDPLFENLDINFVQLEEAGFIICTGLMNDDREHPYEYREILGHAAELRLPMICANPDIIVNWGGRRIWCAGALAEIYKELGGNVAYGGKPHAPIYEQANKVIDRIKPGVAASRILAVGDGLLTDIRGANDQGIDAMLVTGAGGIHDGGGDHADVSAQLNEAGVHATAVAELLRW